MKIGRLPSLFLLRSLIRELRGLREQQTITNTILLRLADHLAPITPVTDPDVVRVETGLSYDDPTDQAIMQDYAAKTYQSTGHWPTDDELMIYLADEKTRDLHARLVDRDAEIARLSREGRG